MSVTNKELEFLFPEKETDIAGRTFTLRPFSFHETFVVMDKLQNVIHLLREDMTVEQIADVIIKCGEGLEDIMAMALQLDVEDVRKFDMKNALKAIREVIGVNKDFFVQFVQEEIPEFKKALEIKEPTRSAKR